jgi:ABC-type phosphate/phosphonate transport system substrate-binding protein
MRRKGKVSGNSGTVNPKSSKSKDFAFWVKTISFIVVCILAIAFLWSVLPQPIKTSAFSIFSPNRPKITLGVLIFNKRQEQRYQDLAADLSSRSKFEFVVDFVETSKDSALKDAEKKISEKKWDIAFARDPFTSIAAINAEYFFVARMVRLSTSDIQTAIIVKQDSPIKTLNDISIKTKLAIGDPSSASLYYMPIYDLYGRGFTKVYQKSEPSYSVNAISALNDNKVDAAVVLYGNGFPPIRQPEKTTEKAPETPSGGFREISQKINDGVYRVITLSRPIPSGSVYISPNKKDDQAYLEKLLREVNPDIMKNAGYDFGQREEDYGFFKGLKKRVDTIVSCADRNPLSEDEVNLTAKRCPETVEGYISSMRRSVSDQFELFVRSVNTEYSVLISEDDLKFKLKSAAILGLQNISSIDKIYPQLDKLSVTISKMMPAEPKLGMTMIQFDFTSNKNSLINLDFKEKKQEKPKQIT